MADAVINNTQAGLDAQTVLIDGGPLGTPSSGTLTNATGLPAATGLTGVVPAAQGGAGTVNGILKADGTGTVSAAVAGTNFVAPGAITTSGLTQATAKLLGRSTASTGAVEEIAVGSGLSLSAGTLTASGGGTVTTTGSPSSGNLTKFSGAASITNADLTGDVTTSGGVATTIASAVVSNAKLATMAAHTIKGNNTGSTAAPLDLTATQATAELNVMVGDSGSGGTKGLVPAPAAGDAAAGKFLKADGTYAAPSGSGAPSSAQYVTLATDTTLTDERVLTAGTNIALTDAGAGSTVTVALDIPLTNDGNSSTSLNLDWGSKKRGEHRFTLTGNVTLTFSNPVDGGAYVALIYTGAGSFSVTWPAAVKWPSGSAPTITATASRLDLVTLIYDATAAVYYGSFNQNYTP